jgi:hypothetical protein
MNSPGQAVVQAQSLNQLAREGNSKPPTWKHGFEVTICSQLRHAVDCLVHPFMFRAVSAAEHPVIGLDAVADDPCSAVVTDRRQRLNRALERIESMLFAKSFNDESLVVVVTAVFTLGHGSNSLHFHGRPAGSTIQDRSTL